MTYEEFYGAELSRLKETETRLLDLVHTYAKTAERDGQLKPVVYSCSRIKKPESVLQKCRLHGWEQTYDAAAENLFDLVGIRVICAFPADVYGFVRWLKARPEIGIIREKDYYSRPKPNGYRSYHIQLLMQGTRAEIQARTIATDFWATLEHQIKYKKKIPNETMIRSELKRCADEIASTDLSMQTIREIIEESVPVNQEGGVRMEYRHEWKIEITAADHMALRSRLRPIMDADPHAIDGRYFIRSLYFDSPADRALREKIDGVNRREKFRIRCYNGDTSLLHLEKKSKLNGLGNKQSAQLTAKEVQALLDGDLSWMMDSGRPLVQELYCKMKAGGLRPKTIVDYEREPFVYRPGNVRVTFDYNIRTGLFRTSLLDPDCVTVPAGDAPILMEVKWDAFLPDIIRDAVQLPGRRAAAFSKYAQCRIYG